MGRLAETIKPPTSGRVYTCKIDTICEDDDDRAVVAKLMASPNSIRSIARELHVSQGSVYSHRSKECACYRNTVA